MALLDVRDLHVSFDTDDGVVEAVQGVTFSVEAGRTLGIVGESGSGKSVSTQALLGLIPGAKVSGSALFEGADLLQMGEDQLRSVRGQRIAMIFQDPLSSLHPLYRVGEQLAEAIVAHRRADKARARARAVELLGMVGVPKPEERARDYPHQFSGGMRQRVMIAMALALEPALIVADEPTTALDVTVQAQILDLLLRMKEEHGTAVILITHDLGVVAEAADEVLIMYAGRVMEAAAVATVFEQPHHPYTQGLLRSIPTFAALQERLHPIPGNPPSLLRMAHECPFSPRCAYVHAECLVRPPPLKAVGRGPGGGGHLSACTLPADRVGLPVAESGSGAARRAQGHGAP